ncbi:hypothetical protein CCMA1212_010551 [Trichoderma ghanense]|uniref:SSCRP protein n=1 Tax=Trichoderma ghanense TaxID=65468 RepID=A0ABY2GQT9_9HYPO
MTACLSHAQCEAEAEAARLSARCMSLAAQSMAAAADMDKSRELEQRRPASGIAAPARRNVQKGKRHTWEATCDDMVAEGLGESWRR